MDLNEISSLELNLLMLYYTYSDQYGKVDMETVTRIARDKMGIYIPPEQINLEQLHVDVLMDLCFVPDTRELLTVVKLEQSKPKKRKTKD